MIRPPAMARLLLHWTAPPDSREAQLGDLEEELRLRAETDPAAARRWYRSQALRSALPNLGGRLRRALRRHGRQQGDGMMGRLGRDLRFAVRTLLRSPAVSALLVLTLALGIAANTTIFSVVHGLLLAPFPFPEPERVVGVGSAYPRLDQPLEFFESLSPAEYADIAGESSTLEDVVAWDMGNRQLTGASGIPDNVFTAFWWGDALRTVGMDAHLGRGFTDEEVARGDAVALLSWELWRDRFGADSTLVGRTLAVNDRPHTVVGILPRGMDVYGTDLWTTMAVGPERFPRNRRQFQVLARLAPGASLEEANTELRGMAERTASAWAAEFEEYEGWRLEARPWVEVTTASFRTALFVVMGAVGFVLLLVCANTATLLLARGRRRAREMAVRTALGAGRGRLVRQLLTESLVLALTGGALGALLARGAVGVLAELLAGLGLPVAGDVVLDGPVLAFTAAAALGAGVVFGLVPAFQVSRTELSSTLKTEGRTSTAGGPRRGLQRTLVGVEVALAFVLLAGSGLLVNSFVRMSRVDPGFAADDVLTMRLTLPREEYAAAAVPAFFQELSERVEALPGVEAAAAGTQFPPVAFSYRELWMEGRTPDPDGRLPVALSTAVSPGYFEALGIPLRRGRALDARDDAGAPPVVVVNETLARRYFGGVDVVGRRLKVGGPDEEAPWWEVVGVVGDTRNRGLDQDPFPEVFAPHAQLGGIQNQLFLVARATVDPRSLLPAVRAAVAEMDADQPVYAVRTVEEAFSDAVRTRTTLTFFLTAFGLFALLLAAVGVYAVVSGSVSERTREIGVRVALGADAGRVRGLVVRQALVPVALGALAGLAVVVPLGGGLGRFLYRVSGTDPLTLGLVGLTLVGVAAVAAFVPAWRASRLDPVDALRAE